MHTPGTAAGRGVPGKTPICILGTGMHKILLIYFTAIQVNATLYRVLYATVCNLFYQVPFQQLLPVQFVLDSKVYYYPLLTSYG